MAILDCNIIRRNLAEDTPGASPKPDRMWKKDGVTYYSARLGDVPMPTGEFMMTYPLLASEVKTPDALVGSVGGSLAFTSDFILTNLTMVMLTPGTTPTTARRLIFESLLGTWTCSVNNSLGTETCSSTVRECGRCWCLCDGVLVQSCLHSVCIIVSLF